jgi:hypothetical protein
MTGFQMRWPDSPHAEVAPGWTKVLTPLGADIHVLINSPAWDVCTEWQLLHSGRGLLSPTDPLDWFSNAELAEMPQGLVAELFAHASRVQAYTRLIVANAEARAHMLRLPDNVYGAEPEESAHIATYVDIARCLDARAMAQAAGDVNGSL